MAKTMNCKGIQKPTYNGPVIEVTFSYPVMVPGKYMEQRVWRREKVTKRLNNPRKSFEATLKETEEEYKKLRPRAKVVCYDRKVNGVSIP